jgi:hypothetical protein
MPKKLSQNAPKALPAVSKPPVLMERTQPVIERLSAALGEPVFTYWNSTKGFSARTTSSVSTPFSATLESSIA